MTRNIVDWREGWRESGSGFAAPALPPTLIIKKTPVIPNEVRNLF
jgi:hypothetical protein